MQFDKRYINSIDNFLHDTYLSLLNTPKAYTPGLLAGDCGMILFIQYYIKYKQSDSLEILQSWLENAIVNYSKKNDYTFATGASGANWLYLYLNNKNILSNEDLKLIFYNKKAIKSFCLDRIMTGHYDLANGAIGPFLSILYNHNEDDVGFFDYFIKAMMHTVEIIFKCKIYNAPIYMDGINLGLAHGLPSILKLCIELYKKNICYKNSKHIAYKIIKFINEHTNSDITNSYFGYNVKKNTDANENSRLAWCYGDLIIGYSILSSGNNIKNNKMMLTGDEIIKKTIERKFIDHYTGIRDNGICHGVSGIIYMSNKILKIKYSSEVISYRNELKDVYEIIKKDTHNRVAVYDEVKNELSLIDSYGFIEGLSGIGLSLLSLTHTNDQNNFLD